MSRRTAFLTRAAVCQLHPLVDDAKPLHRDSPQPEQKIQHMDQIIIQRLFRAVPLLLNPMFNR